MSEDSSIHSYAQYEFQPGHGKWAKAFFHDSPPIDADGEREELFIANDTNVRILRTNLIFVIASKPITIRAFIN